MRRRAPTMGRIRMMLVFKSMGMRQKRTRTARQRLITTESRVMVWRRVVLFDATMR